MELDHETAVRAAAMGEAHQRAGGPHLDAWDDDDDDDSDSFGSAASRHDDDDENDDAAIMPPADDDGAIPRHDAAYDDEDDDDEEEAECRVCRGPAEEGRPLFSPCKCSGSIGLCHQDCLTSWLEVTHGGGGRCELCSYRFRFQPLYAPDAPDRLPPHEVLLGLGRSAIVRFLPYASRIGLSLIVWLGVLPLGAAYLYQGWFHSPKTIAARWRSDLLLRDGVSGAVVAAIVVVSFLSLMSLADFMRFQWNPADAAAANEEENEEARAEVEVGGMPEAAAAMAAENNVDAEGENLEPVEAAMPDPFEMDAGVNPGRHHHHHRRGQWQRQRDTAPLDADGTDRNVENHNVHDEADSRARMQMERIRGRIEERRRQNRDVVQRENSRPMSPDLSDDDDEDDLYDDDFGDHATAAADRRSSLHETDLLLPLDSPLDTWLGRTDAAAGAASSSSPPHSRTGSLSSLPSLHRDAVGVMDEGEPFFSNDRARARTRSTDDDDEELRRRRRLLAERAALRRQGGDDDAVVPKNDDEDIDLIADKSEGAQYSSPRTPNLEREAIDDDISDLASNQAAFDEPDYDSDDSTTIPPPLESVEMMDPVDEAALENMMRLQEEAMLDLDSDDESEDGDADLQADAPVAQQQGQPQNDGGRFEPQFGRDERFEQEEEEDMEMEFQLALDELLGFRGPVITLLRNLGFFLAFITTYLGIFGFVPYHLGSFASRSRLLTFLARPLASVVRRLLDHLQIMVNVHFNVATVTTNASDVANLTMAMNALNASNVVNLTDSFAFPTAFTALAADSAPITAAAAAELSAAKAIANNTLVAVQINGTASLPDACVILLRVLDFESQVWNTIFRLPDIVKLVLGYFVIGAIVIMLQALVSYITRPPTTSEEQPPGDRRRLAPILLNAQEQEAPERLNDDDNGQDAAALQEELEHQDEYIEIKLNVVTDYARAVMKVCILLFLKMVILPLTLGLSLDLATLELFNATVQSRALYASKDLFGSLLMHWVAGITFMLLVTVSVLQLREVIHPDLLARVIRPQEPQPDLLGNLLKERGFTHAKRMLLSLSIYLGLLVANVWAPGKLLIMSGLSKSIPVFQPKIWHAVIPQLQIPIELFVFHLAMLAFLEKYKNCIGMLQHKWLVAICDIMGLTDYLIPKEVGMFTLVASKPIFRLSNRAPDPPGGSFDSEGDSVPPLDEATIMTETTSSSASTLMRNYDSLPAATKKSRQPTKASASSSSTSKELDPFWTELISMSKEVNVAPGSVDDFIVAHLNAIGNVSETGRRHLAATTEAGKRVLADEIVLDEIVLPTNKPPSSSLLTFYEDGTTLKMNETASSVLLPTTIGAYRFRSRPSTGETMKNGDSWGSVIEIWKEDRATPIPRPPEGWDDLGVGGAEVQGRWAWDKEKKSKIEEGVAHRSTFFGTTMKGETRLASALRRWPKGLFLSFKVVALIAISWLAMSVSICCGITAPLIAGRFIYFLLQLPDRFIHDPIAYTAGAGVAFPLLAKIVRLAAGNKFAAWKSGFHLPPRGSRKLRYVMQALFLWFAAMPLLLGLTYHLFVVKGTSFWLYKESPFSRNDIAMAWGVGTLLLNSWAGLCYVGAFKLGFWLNLLAGPLEVDPAAQPVVAPGAPNIDNADAGAGADVAEVGNDGPDAPPLQPELVAGTLLWQGQDGLIGRLVDIMYAVLGKWEWDKVDRDILLTQCLIPITQQLTILLLGPICAYLGWSTLLSALTRGRGGAGIILPFVGLVEKDIYRRFFYRCFAVTTTLIQLASIFQPSLQSWFRAAHKAARDDRYLKGEVLMNYVR